MRNGNMSSIFQSDINSPNVNGHMICPSHHRDHVTMCDHMMRASQINWTNNVSRRTLIIFSLFIYLWDFSSYTRLVS